ncbi:DHA2 family efflux MFS transporter permease subunit [Thalassobacillus sp. CUG 92003]|uniref:DHA2 family efflux MFS transporter permease subunit n=1 Tax=Thalassobacillus sp. CUG 92003 TaxID=2736641 RepID=UPI0015E7BEB2|nr:DHA2 family efflux MFS transporter permease subunit [Thalassobacillus sp. CUG 92003]
MRKDKINQIKRGPMTAVLMVGSFISILNLTLLTTAIPSIMEVFHLSANEGQWLNTAFIVVLGILIPITAYFIKNYSVRKLFYSAMGAFTLGTFLSSIAFSFEILLLGRVIQAVGAGIMFPLVKSIVVLMYPINKRGTIMGIGGLVASFAPAIGPTLAGWLIELFSWRAVFITVLPIAAIDMLVGYFVLADVTEQERSNLDIKSLLLSTIGFGGLLLGCSLAGQKEMSIIFGGSSIILGALSVVLFTYRQLTLDKPILEFRVFKNSMFTVATIVAIISFSLMISAETILPIYMHQVLEYSPLEAGLVLLPGSVVFGIVTLVSGIIYDRVGVRWLAIIGLTIVAISTYLFTDLTSERSFAYITIIQTVRMLGISMLNMPIQTAGLNQLQESLIPDGSTMMSALRQVFAGVGTALFITIITLTSKTEGGAGLIKGVNHSFLAATLIAIIGVLLSTVINERAKTYAPK